MRTIYVKPWDGCNLACDMCYNAQMVNHKPMSDRTLRLAYREILKAKERYGHVLVHLHGGAPMLVKNLDLLELCRAVRSEGCDLTITTNLTYEIDPQKSKILSLMSPSPDGRFEHFIQTSWDYGTVRWKKKADRVRFENNVYRLRQNGFGLQGTVCVTKPLIDAYTRKADHLLAELGELFHVINFERLTQNGNLLAHPELIPSHEEIDEFFYWLWVDYKRSDLMFTPDWVPIPILDDIVFSILRPNVWLGCRARKCTDTVMTINPDGSVATCPNVSHEPNWSIISFKENAPKFKPIETVRQEETQQKAGCLACDVFHICHGDCYQLALDSSPSDCHGLPRTIHRIVEDLEHDERLRHFYEQSLALQGKL